jgi:hypothetical protein
MEKGRSLFVIFLVLLLVLQCKEGNDKRKQLSPFDDAKFHFVLYTDPSSDCLDCNFTAIDFLGKHRQQDQTIEICLKESNHNDNFKRLLREKFNESKFHFLEFNMDIPHPSIILIKGNSVYMHLYVANDHFLMRDYVSVCAQFFSNITRQ